MQNEQQFGSSDPTTTSETEASSLSGRGAVADRLSPTMQEALNVARLNGGRLTRLPGGFWTYPGCPCDERRMMGFHYTSEAVPNWYVSALTVKALVARGYVEADEFGRSRSGEYMVGVKLTAKAK